MIEGIQYIEGRLITEEDINSPVTYIPSHARGDASHKDAERGTIKRVNKHGVFVDYIRNVCLTRADLLVWG